MSEFAIKKATRQGVIPLVGFVGLSGGGKTLSGLKLARGYVGKSGKVGCIDTENRRALHFAEEVDFDHIQLDPPFSPQRYSDALSTFESGGYGAVVIDSMTHEWAGAGGYLEMKEQELGRLCGNDWEKRKKMGPAVTARIKPMHERLVQQILRSKMAIILCFRGKQKLRIEKGQGGKTEFNQDDYVSPIQDSGIIFECLLGGEVYSKECEVNGVEMRMGGYFKCTFKHTHNSLLKVIPGSSEQWSEKHGEAIAKWCAAPGASQPVKPPANPLKAELWKLTAGIHKGDTKALLLWIVDELGLQTVTSLESLTDDELETVLAKARQKLSERRAA